MLRTTITKHLLPHSTSTSFSQSLNLDGSLSPAFLFDWVPKPCGALQTAFSRKFKGQQQDVCLTRPQVSGQSDDLRF